jgi:hypothetical protein
MDITQTNIMKGAQFRLKPREMSEEFQRLIDGHIQHLGDILAFELYLQYLAVVAPAAANLTGYGDIG